MENEENFVEFADGRYAQGLRDGRAEYASLNRDKLARLIALKFARRPWLSMPDDADRRALMRSQGICPPVTDDELTTEGAYEAADFIIREILQ